MSNPQQMKEMVEITYWQCDIHDHRHKTKAGAISCMQRNAGRVKRERHQLLDDRKAQASLLIDMVSGMTQDCAAKKYGCPKSMVRSYTSRSIRTWAKSGSWISRDISTRPALKEMRKDKHAYISMLNEYIASIEK